MNDSAKLAFLMNKVKEQEFKLKALQSFIFEHHHILTHQGLKSDETSKALVWVEYPDGRKEESLNNQNKSKGEP